MVIDDASHALFPEQPDMVANTVLAWLARYREASVTLAKNPKANMAG